MSYGPTGLPNYGMTLQDYAGAHAVDVMGQQQVQKPQLETQQNIAKIGAGAQTYTSDQQRAAAENVAAQNAAAAIKEAQIGAGAQTGVAQTQAEASKYGSQQSAQASMYGSDAARAAAEYSANQQLAGINAQEAARTGRFNQALGWAQNEFGQVWPFVQQQLGGLGGTAAGLAGGAAAGSGGGVPGTYYTPTSPAPEITTGGVYSPNQVQQGKNAAFANATQNYLTKGRQIGQQAAGRGVSDSYQSPLTQALTNANASQGIATGLDQQRQFEQIAAQQNAAQLLSSQQANYQDWLGQQNLQLQAQQNKYNYSSALLSALTGMIGNIMPNA